MQKFAVLSPIEDDTYNNPLDIVGYCKYEFTTPHYIVLDFWKDDGSCDVIIYSAHHKFECALSKYKNRLAVVSYIPNNPSYEWLQFYANIYDSTIVACDSFVYAQGNEQGLFKNKIWINLDGAIIPDQLLIKKEQQGATVGIIGEEREIIALTNYINSEENRAKDVGFEVVVDLNKANYIVSLTDLGFSLTNVFTRIKPFVQIPYNDKTAHFLDSRYTHNHKIKQLAAIVGGGGSKVLKEVLDVFFEEFLTLSVHNVTSDNPAVPYISNISIFDRIFHELNRSK